MLWSPVKVALLGIAAWIAIRFVSPIEARMPLAPSALLFIGLCYVAFIVGCVFTWPKQRQALARGIATNARFSVHPGHELIAGLLGLLGIGLRYVDRVFLRGVDYGAGSAEIRDVLANSSVSAVGMIGSLLFPVCMIPLILVLQREELRKVPVRLTLCGILFCLPMLESFGQLSRSVMLVSAMLLVFAIAWTRFDGAIFRLKIIGPAVLGVVSLLFVSAAIFDARLQNEQRDLDTSILTSVYSELIAPSEDAISGLLGGDRMTAATYQAILPNSLYYTSGMYEFSLLWDRPDRQIHALGTYTFAPIFLGLDVILGTQFLSRIDETGLVYRLGVFNTFFGPVWIDFRWFSFVFMMLFGAIVSKVVFAARYKNPALMPLALMLSVIVFYMPVVNLINNGLGIFFLIAFIGYGTLASIFGLRSKKKSQVNRLSYKNSFS